MLLQWDYAIRSTLHLCTPSASLITHHTMPFLYARKTNDLPNSRYKARHNVHNVKGCHRGQESSKLGVVSSCILRDYTDFAYLLEPCVEVNSRHE